MRIDADPLDRKHRPEEQPDGRRGEFRDRQQRPIRPGAVSTANRVTRPFMYRRAQRDVVDHVRLRQKKTSSDANSSRKIKFLLFPEKSGGWIEETTLPLLNYSGI
jgi:hypothetical protein